MKTYRFFVRTALLVVSCLALAACENDGDDSDNPLLGGLDEKEETAGGPAAGAWTGTRANADGAAAVRFDLVQKGDALTGTYTDNSGFKGAVTGTNAGTDVDLSIVLTEAPAPWETGKVWIFDGALASEGGALNGVLKGTNPFGEALAFNVATTK